MTTFRLTQRPIGTTTRDHMRAAWNQTLSSAGLRLGLLTLVPGLLIAPLSMAHAASAPATTVSVAPPTDLHDLTAWTSYKASHHVTALPEEARLFYRSALIAHGSGQHEAAVADLRGACELDPSYIQPHLTLASWLLWSDPAQSLRVKKWNHPSMNVHPHVL